MLSLAEAEQSLADFGLMVQTTSVGMNFAQQGMPFNPDNVSEGTVVADIIYNPLETEFLAQARAKGAQDVEWGRHVRPSRRTCVQYMDRNPSGHGNND